MNKHKPLNTFICSNCREEKEETAVNVVVGSTICGDCFDKLQELVKAVCLGKMRLTDLNL